MPFFVVNKGVIIGVIVAVVAIGGLSASPLFYETEIDEPLLWHLIKLKKV
jgi:hypothetical protein